MAKATVKIELAGEEIELVPSLAAMEYLSAKFDNFQAVYAKLATVNFEAYAHVIVAGVLPKKVNFQTVKENICETGLTSLLTPLFHYVTILLNGGKEPTVQEEAKSEEGE